MNNLEKNPGYVVSDIVLAQETAFTIDEIVEALGQALAEFLDSIEKIISFITEKLRMLCEIGLVTYTGLVYYVNS